MSLPVDAVEDQVVAQLSRGPYLVICAAPGSGKTTRVPPMLAKAGRIDGQILVLQPRRLATRLVAQRVAAEAGEIVGASVGYQTRHERAVSDATRICFMTEGLLLRRLLSSPTLPGVGAVVLDEFHERSLTLDMTLGLLKGLVATRRPDLRIIVMSATLDARSVCDYLHAPLIEASGRSYPVDVGYLSARSTRPVWDVAGDEVRRIVKETDEGDILVFMPGVFEINRTLTACRRAIGGEVDRIALLPLHGSLPPAQQDAAVAPAAMRGQRKVIVSTNVAETSITIDGVRHVVDSGLARTPRYDARRGLNVLLASPISRASADQRAGRAGRTAPGTCVRLWTEGDHRGRAAHETPEAQRLDLAESVLQLKAMGIDDPPAFDWLDAPPPQSLEHATDLLHRLDAIDRSGRLSSLGKTMAAFPLHPRLSRMLVESIRRGCAARGCLWAALASDRPIMTRNIEPDIAGTDYSVVSDLLVMERAFESARDGGFRREACEKAHVHGQACREVDQVRRQLEAVARRVERRMRTDEHRGDASDIDLIKCLLAAFPDHVAFRHDAQKPTCAMIGRRRVVVDRYSAVQAPGLLLALDVREVGQGDGVRTVLSMISRIEPDWLREVHPDLVTVTKRAVWNQDMLAVEEAEQHTYDGLVFQETRRGATANDVAAAMLVDHLLSQELRPLSHWDEKVEQWLARVRCVAQWAPQRGLIQYDDDDLRLVLLEIVAGATRLNQVRDRDCLSVVMNAMSWDDQQFVARMAPTSLPLPSGARMKLTYQFGAAPRGRAKIQELYDLTQTPTVAGGRQRVLLEILGPNYRPVQVTDDLTSFWETTYPQLKKELKRRYPKHEWR